MLIGFISCSERFFRILGLVSLLFLGGMTVALSGCDGTGSEGEETEEFGGEGGQAPAILVEVPGPDFGFVHVGTPQTLTVSIVNEGSPPPDSVDEDGVLEGEVDLAESERFGIESGRGAYSLAPGDTQEVVVEFDPAEHREESQALLEITHNDDDEDSPVSVALEGEGVEFEGGVGSQRNPYQIAEVSQLQVIDSGLLERHFIQVADVDAGVTSGWNEDDGFIPIGDREDGRRFTGQFDGRGHVISGLYIDRSDEHGVALFSSVGDAVIENVVLRKIDITGASQVGSVVGQNLEGEVQDVDVQGDIEGDISVGGVVGAHIGGPDLQSSRARVAVTGEALVGGLVGRNVESRIRNSVGLGRVEGTAEAGQVGGLVGRNVQGDVLQSSSQADVFSSGERGQVGGLVGRNVEGLVSQSSYAEGTVEGKVSAGGLVGVNFGGGEVRGSVAGGTVVSGDRGGGLVGRNAVQGQIVNSHASADVDADRNAGGLVGLNRERIRACWAHGSVQGEANVGGLVGANLGEIRSSYARGSVEGDSRVGGLVGRSNGGVLEKAYAAGAVTGGDEVGGLVGRQEEGEVGASYWDTAETRQSEGVGVQQESSVQAQGFRTEQMTGANAEDNMGDFDFSNTWRTVVGDYPALRWEDQ